MSAADHRFLIVGAGSIGRRHAANLRAAGARALAVCDSDSSRAAVIDGERFSEVEQALDTFRPDAVLICTPPTMHAAQAIAALRAGGHVFVEKPVATSLSDVDELADEASRAGKIVQVGYNLQFDDGFLALRDLLRDDTIGRPLLVRAEFGQYLPDWRPWQDYRESYTAREELGGGIILDGSHELACVISLLGRPEAVACLAGTVSTLEVDVEDAATILLRFPGGAQADVHLDFVQRGYWRSFKVSGERGSIVWDEAAGTVVVDTGKPRTIEITQDANAPYERELAAFVRSLETGQPPDVGLSLARDTLEVVLLAKAAAANVVEFPP